MQGLLAGVLDHNKCVQEAACSGLATLEEEAGLELAPKLQVRHELSNSRNTVAQAPRNHHTMGSYCTSSL